MSSVKSDTASAMSRGFDASKYLSAALVVVPRIEVPLGRAGGSANAGDDALFPDDVGHGIEQFKAVVAQLGGGGLRNVKHPRNRTHQQVVPTTIGPLVLLLLSPLPPTTLPLIALALRPP